MTDDEREEAIATINDLMDALAIYTHQWLPRARAAYDRGSRLRHELVPHPIMDYDTRFDYPQYARLAAVPDERHQKGPDACG